MTFDHDAAIEAINHRRNFTHDRLNTALTVIVPTVFVSGAITLTVSFFTVSVLMWLPFALGVTVTVFMLVWCHPTVCYRAWAHRFPEKANRLKELDDYSRS